MSGNAPDVTKSSSTTTEKNAPGRALSPVTEPTRRAANNPIFATTHWSLVLQAADAISTEGKTALAELCRIYWYPVYCFARRRGHSEADAKDLTQGFFAKLLTDGAVGRADATRGRFRTYLLAMFEHYRAHEHARATRLKRGGGCEIVSLDGLQDAEARFEAEPATTDSPERLFDKKWAQLVIAAAFDTVGREYAAAGKAALFDDLKDALWGECRPASYVDIARRLGTNEGAVRVAAFRLRQRIREQMRLEVTQTLVRSEDAEDELRHLFSALGA